MAGRAKVARKPKTAAKSGIEYVTVSLGELHEDPANARLHGEKNLAAIAASLREFGQVEPLVVQRSSGKVIGGNGRLAAMRQLGWTECKIAYVDIDNAKAAALGITLNRTAELAEWDTDVLGRLLAEMEVGDEALKVMLGELKCDWPIAVDGGEEELDFDDQPEDALDLAFKSPYPWFGGKSRVAKIVWKYLGDVSAYIEPFFGSGAVFLNRPQPFDGTETINDFDGLVANFWRAVQAAPDEVAKFADWPVNENDANARHIWLVNRKDTLQAKLEGDPDYFDAKIAGWWCWGMACWIGSGFCAGDGPWQVVESEDGTRQLVHLGDAGRGVNRQLVHLGDAGHGVNRQLVADSASEGKPGCGERGLYAWMQALSERLRRVRVCCGDWTRICGGTSGDALGHFFGAGDICGIFLDPPYADTAGRNEQLYSKESLTVAHDVREWAIAHGDDERLRIVLCGYEDEREMPSTWRKVKWKAHGGMAMLGNNQARQNKFRERLWISPHCLPKEV